MKKTSIQSMKEDFFRGLGLSRRWSQITIFQVFHFPEILRTGLAIRQNEKNLDEATYELGEFAYQRKEQRNLDEGDQVEWDLLKGRFLRFMEERNRLLGRSQRSELVEMGLIKEQGAPTGENLFGKASE